MSDYRDLLEQLRLEKRELTWRAFDAIKALMAEPEDLTLQICFDKVVKDRDAYKARAERAEAALRPFAKWCDEMENEGPVLQDSARVSSDITMGDVRRARAVRAKIEGEGRE